MYLKRDLEDKIKQYLKTPEIIAVLGSRQVGKTTLLQKMYSEQENAIFLTFEDIEIRILFDEDIKSFIKLYIEPYKIIFIDEFQYAKNGGQKLKFIYDTNPGKKIIISGSSTIDLTIEAVMYLAGRIFLFHLYPFNFTEYLHAIDYPLYTLFVSEDKFSKTIRQQIYRYLEIYLKYGGYPRVILADSEKEKKEILKNIINIYLLKDIKDAASIADESQMYKLLKALSLQIGNLIVYNELKAISSLTHQKLKQALSIFEKLFLIKLLSPFFTNKRVEISKNPKVYFMDMGIRNAIIGDFRALDERMDKGAIYENYIFKAFYEKDQTIKYYRSKSGAEVDFIINDTLPIEIKSRLSKPYPSKSFRNYLEKYNPAKGIIFNTTIQDSIKIKNSDILFSLHFEAEKIASLIRL